MIIAFITIWVLCFYWNLVIWKDIYNEKEGKKLMGSIMLVTMIILGPVALISSILTKYV